MVLQRKGDSKRESFGILENTEVAGSGIVGYIMQLSFWRAEASGANGFQFWITQCTLIHNLLSNVA